MKQLAAKLAPEDEKLLEKYDESRIDQMCRQDEIIYIEGLMDGMLFGYWAALVGRGIGKIIVWREVHPMSDFEFTITKKVINVY